MDAVGDHIEEVYSSIGLVTALHVERIDSLCLLNLVKERTLSISIVLNALAIVLLVFVVSELRVKDEDDT